jgi:proteasome lid subunit RPN8/RPN11
VRTLLAHTQLISLFCTRVPCTNHPASVENNPEDQHAANQRFGDEGVQYVGWYHSHPRLDPTPSDKDIMMQSELQKQLPYCVGMICSPFGKVFATREVSPFYAFRMNDTEGVRYAATRAPVHYTNGFWTFYQFGQVRIAIPMLIERRLCVPTPFNQREILHTDRVCR